MNSRRSNSLRWPVMVALGALSVVVALGALWVLHAVPGTFCPEVAAAKSDQGDSIGAYGGNLSEALQAIGDTEITLYIDAPATLLGDATVPATLGLAFCKGGSIVHGAHKLRINGPLSAGPYPIFDGTGEITIADNAVTELFVEWWGGAADDATDNTPALAAAVAAMTNPTIRLLQGTYLGVVAASGKIIDLHGSGKWKTTLKNNDPAAKTIYLAGSGSHISDMKVDLNDAPTTGVHLDGCTYIDVQRLHIVRQGGGDKYALHVSHCTLSSFQDIIISYGAMHVDTSYYSHFKNISIAEPRGTVPTLHIANTAALQFFGLYVEHGQQGAIVLEGADNVNFYGIGIEIADAVSSSAGFIRVLSGTAINFYGGRINQYSNAGWPMFDLRGVRGCKVDGWVLHRSVQDDSPFIALGAGLDNVQISNVEFSRNPVAAPGVQSAPGPENRAGRVILENLTHGEHPVNHAINAADPAVRNVKGEVASL